MTLSMPNTRKVIRKQEEVAAALRAGLKAKGVTRHSQREKLVQRAASGRPADLPQTARSELAKWRHNREVQKVIDSIAGRAT